MPEYGLVGARLPSRREVFGKNSPFSDGKTIYYDYFAPVLHCTVCVLLLLKNFFRLTQCTVEDFKLFHFLDEEFN